jgi:CO/xanthine dehydrogenase Mo-binding subunit
VLLNPYFGDAAEMSLIELKDPNGPSGASGIVEAPITPTATAIATATYDAVGVRVISFPSFLKKFRRFSKSKIIRSKR